MTSKRKTGKREGTVTPAPPVRELSAGHLEALREAKERWDRDWGPRHLEHRAWPDAAIAEVREQLDRVQLWEAVILSLGYDPACFRVEPNDSASLKDSTYLRHAIAGDVAVCLTHCKDKIWVDRERALALASENHGVNSLQGRLTIAVSHHGIEHGVRTTVRLDDFAPWAVDLGWKVPDGFLRGLPKPDWSIWSQRLEAVITHATALSCNIDPDRIRGNHAQLREYFRRGRIVDDRVNSGELPVVSRPSGVNPAVTHVRLADYARVAEGLGWSLPAEFPRPTSAPAPTVEKAIVTTTSARPLSTRERTSLLTIIAVLAEDAKVSIAQPYKAGELIETAAKARGTPIGRRKAGDILKEISETLPPKNKD